MEGLSQLIAFDKETMLSPMFIQFLHFGRKKFSLKKQTQTIQ
jgi:hypothetical protein